MYDSVTKQIHLELCIVTDLIEIEIITSKELHAVAIRLARIPEQTARHIARGDDAVIDVAVTVISAVRSFLLQTQKRRQAIQQGGWVICGALMGEGVGASKFWLGHRRKR